MSRNSRRALPIDLSTESINIAESVLKQDIESGLNAVLLGELESGQPELTEQEIYWLMACVVDATGVDRDEVRGVIKELYNELDQYTGGE